MVKPDTGVHVAPRQEVMVVWVNMTTVKMKRNGWLQDIFWR